MAHKIAILMSTYNGEKYLREQIQSILNQTNHDWHLYIRDDGSKDNTPKIIRKYANQYDNITFFNDDHIKNEGVLKSFMDLLDHVDAEFYMFSDQDDYWQPFKVEETLKAMLKANYRGKPVCVHTSLKAVDETLKKPANVLEKTAWNGFERLLFLNCVTGCTVMINSMMKSYIKFDDIDFSRIYMHDWWFALIASAFGQLVYVNKETMLYRQHGNNVEGGARKNSIGWMFWRFTHPDYVLNDMRKVVQIAYEFNREYGSQLSGRKKAYVEGYGGLIKSSGFFHNIRLVMNYPPIEHSPKGRAFFDFDLIVYHKFFRTL